MLVADATFAPIERAAVLRRALPHERIQWAKITARLQPRITSLSAQNVLDVEYEGEGIRRYAEEIDNGEELWQ